MKAASVFLNALLAIGLVIFAGLHFAWIRIPPNFLPWAKIDLDSPPGWAPRFRINSLSADAEQCLATLARSRLSYRVVPDRPEKDGCSFEGGVRVAQSHVAYNQPPQARCEVIAGLYWYEQDLSNLAREIFRSDLACIEQWGTYACRNINGRPDGRRSQHARANAIDIAAFILTDGTTIHVARAWGADTPKGRFLEGAHKSACRYFNAVLGPRYNSAHRDHFHLDLGRARICR